MIAKIGVVRLLAGEHHHGSFPYSLERPIATWALFPGTVTNVLCLTFEFCVTRTSLSVTMKQPYAKKSACYMHLTDNNMRKATCMLNECCNRFLHSCNMHVSCNMRGFGTFNKHVTCMLQARNMHVTSM